MSERLINTTLVVGAASAIGEAVVKKLDKVSANLILTWHAKEIDNTDKETYQLDLSSFKSISELVEKLKEKTLSWCNLVYIAGDYWADKSQPLKNNEEWEKASRLFSVNATAFSVLVRELNSCLEKNSLNGRVVAVSSTSAEHGYTGSPIYAASKAALNRLVKDAASRYGKVLSVSAVAPGPVDTPMLASTPKGKEEYEKETPSGILSRPENVADAVVFLLLNPQANGIILTVDGGRIIK